MSAETLRRAAALIRRDHSDEFFLAVADWLIETALTWDEHGGTRGGTRDAVRGPYGEALGVARAYLGETA
jgi:hypothetical protein